jgi:hypothetical protein
MLLLLHLSAQLLYRLAWDGGGIEVKWGKAVLYERITYYQLINQSIKTQDQQCPKPKYI